MGVIKANSSEVMPSKEPQRRSDFSASSEAQHVQDSHLMDPRRTHQADDCMPAMLPQSSLTLLVGGATEADRNLRR